MFLALSRAFISLLHPRLIWVMVWPVLAALGAWLVIAALFWNQALQWIDIQLRSFGVVQWMLSVEPLAFVVANLGWILLIVAFIPLVLVTSVILIGFFAMPAMVQHVSQASYPGLARRRGGSVAGSVWNSVVAVVVFLVLAVITLPLWVVPLLWPVITVLLFAYLNQRVFRYDALAEHASAEEMRLLFSRWKGEFFLLGVAIAIAGHIPVFGFFVPVYGALVFIHYGFQRLADLRSEPIEGETVTRVLSAR